MRRTMRVTAILLCLVVSMVHGRDAVWIDDNQRNLQSNGPSAAPTTSSAATVKAPSAAPTAARSPTGGSGATLAPSIGTPSQRAPPTTANAASSAPSGASSSGSGGKSHNISTVPTHKNNTSTASPNASPPSSPSSTSGGAASSVPSWAPSSKQPTFPSHQKPSKGSGGSPVAPISFGSKHPSLPSTPSSFARPSSPVKKIPTHAPNGGIGGVDDYFDGSTPTSRTEKPEKYIPKDDDPVAKENETPAQEWQEVQETNDQLMRDKRLLIAFGTLLGASFLLLVLTAQQLLENPHGCCASLCRMTVACMCCLARCVCYPCRAMCGNRDRRTHDLMLTERNSYTHDLELN